MPGRARAAAGALVLCGFLLRLHQAQGSYLSGDEALHFHVFHQASASDVYRQSLGNAHPPLYFLFLHFWSLAGDTELFLRLPGVVCGSLFLWQAWRWAELALGRRAAFVALPLLSFSPELILLSAQLRAYGLFLLCGASTWLWLERALAERSSRALLRFGAWLSLAILVHYSALWLALSAAGLALLRRRELPAPLLRLWLATQALALLLYAWLGTSHLLALHGSPMAREAMDSWLRSSYFQPGQDAALRWIPRQLDAFFRWLLTWPRTLFGAEVVERALPSRILLAAYLAGVVALAWRRRAVAWLLAAPALLGLAAGLLRLYPFGGTRHSAFFALAAAGGVGAGADALPRGGRAVGLGLALLAPLALALRAADPTLQWAVLREAQGVHYMARAVAAIEAERPGDEILLADQQTLVTLEYYLARDQIAPSRAGPEGLLEATLHGRRVLASPLWQLSGQSLPGEIEKLARAYQLPPGTPLRIASVGLTRNLGLELLAAGSPPPSLEMFGRGIALFRTAVP